MKTYSIAKRNELKLKRLGRELEELKLVSKPMWKVSKRDLARVIAFDKQGGAPRNVKKMIDEELPESFLPKDH